MPRTNRIEDYAMIGDLHTAALVGRDGSVDWLCLPRFDAPACFAALLGDAGNGHWLIAPDAEIPGAEIKETRRRYRGETLVLETEYQTDTGTVAVIDLMPHIRRSEHTEIIRLVEGRAGRVPMRTEIVLRFDYGQIVPWVRHDADGLNAIAGPDALVIRTKVPLEGRDFRTEGRFTVGAGQTVPFVLTCYPSYQRVPPPVDPLRQLQETERWWTKWAAQCSYRGPWREPVIRSLITLKGLSHAPTGGIVAAPTTSLPELIGGVRNWDYRYCWVRDSTFTLYSLLISGYHEEAKAWREWLLRAVAGSPAQLQPLYGVAGERRLTEFEVPWLAGFEGSKPVRIGNAASLQCQNDIYGELMDTLHVARTHDIDSSDNAWQLQRALLDFLETRWDQPDRGIWEMRGPERHLTHSKVMMWVALDRAVKGVRRFGLDGPVDRWTALRDRIHAEICRRGFNPARNAFVQSYESDALDGSLLMIPLVGFLPATDPRVAGTVEAIRNELLIEGFVRRYIAEDGTDGLVGGEGVFLPCSFWLADCLAMMGREDEAKALLERLLSLRNDVGLLAEEYDPHAGRLLGNFPQAFTHVALVNTAYNLTVARGPSERRAGG